MHIQLLALIVLQKAAGAGKHCDYIETVKE